MKDAANKVRDGILSAYFRCAKKLNRKPGYSDLSGFGVTKAAVRHHFDKLSCLHEEAGKVHPDLFRGFDATTPRDRILRQYSDVVESGGGIPSLNALAEAGVTDKMIRHHFSNRKKLHDEARAVYPHSFRNLIDERRFTPEAFALLRKEVSKYQNFVITTAVVGCQVHQGFLDSIKLYCSTNKAKLLVLPSADPASVSKWTIDSRVGSDSIVFSDLRLNRNLFVSAIKLSAKQIDPITGLSRIGQRDGSFVFASPKQRLRFIPVANVNFPHAMMTTGAITVQNYDTERYMSERTAYIASHDHVLGALVVELEDDGVFHFRQVQAEPETGAFADLGRRYHGGTKEVTTYRPDAIVLGDLHAGETETKALEAFLSVSKTTGAAAVVVHDGFNGKSINHHERKRVVLQALNSDNSVDSLDGELDSLAASLARLAGCFDSVYVVKSNHDEFLDRYLDDGAFLRDRKNFSQAVKMISHRFDGNDPIPASVKERLGKQADNIVWLKRDDDFKIAGIQLGAHGDHGPNGARGNARNLETAYGDCVVGHAHTPEILRGCYVVGTLSKLRLGYNLGPSSWMHTSCLVYPNGSRQLINLIDYRWTNRKK